MKTEAYNDTQIIIGQRAQENWDIINFKSDYIWLHLHSFPSCHVIIKDNNPDEEVLNYAANLCKNNTKYKNMKNLYVSYTKCNNLKKGPDVGSVIYKSNKQVKKWKITDNIDYDVCDFYCSFFLQIKSKLINFKNFFLYFVKEVSVL